MGRKLTRPPAPFSGKKFAPLNGRIRLSRNEAQTPGSKAQTLTATGAFSR